MLRIVYSGGIDPLTWCFALFPKPSVPEPLQWRFEFFSIVYLFPFFQLNRLCFPWVGWKLNSKKRRSLRREVVTNWHFGGGGSAFLLLWAGTSLGIFLVYEKLPAGIRKYQGWSQDASGWNLIFERKENPDGINGTLSHLRMISLHFGASPGAVCVRWSWPWWLTEAQAVGSHFSGVRIARSALMAFDRTLSCHIQQMFEESGCSPQPRLKLMAPIWLLCLSTWSPTDASALGDCGTFRKQEEVGYW